MRKLMCEESDYTESTETCAVPVWVEDTGFFPALSVSDAWQVAAAIIGVWLLGFAMKAMRRVLD
ncbi:MAG: hypothetical protein JNK21_03505 [Rhodospirillaceae bacterium]|nr:hypothetical protein [Rhodospirillaceae bacterium]